MYSMKRFFTIITLLLFVFAVQPSLFAQEKKEKEKVAVSDSNLPELIFVDNILYVKNAPIGKKVQILTIYGYKMREIEMKSTEGEYPLNNLPKGFYVAKLEGKVRKFVVK